ncbi:MAG: TlpA family protein disulfide reductase [Flavobacteriaceae bacterium]|nr:TlpA family protein disulfide reductase [Flavobacteriaceae bacterium]
MKTITLLLLTLILLNCTPKKTTFDAVALDETFTNLNGEQISFREIINQYKGKTIFIDIWASWCGDCVASIPNFKKLQAAEKEIVYLMLSVDKNNNTWKKGIKKYDLQADHYLITKGWESSDFCKSIHLDWIPRYMIVGKDGTIKMYKAIKFDDPEIKKIIKEDK